MSEGESMLYLSKFNFPSYDKEYSFRLSIKRTCYDTIYPFFVLSNRGLETLEFEPITILYGGNGSGKSTALNIMAETLQLKRDTIYNSSSFFEDYIKMCSFEQRKKINLNSRIITSDDVFDYMLNIRTLNQGIDQKRENLFEEYLNTKYATFKFQSLEDYEQLKKVCETRSKTQSKYVRNHLNNNIRTYSNGESAYQYFTEKILDGGLYLLDEPENSLSPQKQLELLQFLEDSVRFYDCQFIIATHSPFLLSLKGARIYDMDAEVVDIKPWTKLKNVREYYNFFKQYEDEFKK